MRLYRAFATVGALTMVSRVLGFIRDIAIAALLGAGPVAEAFFAALRFPNLFRRLFAEGAFNAAFVPLFAKRLRGDGAETATDFARNAMSGLVLVLLLITGIATIAMPWLTLVNAPGFSTDPAKFDLTVALTRITFPYLLLMSVSALLTGVLNSLGRFMAGAAAPILLNLVLIVALAIAWVSGAGDGPTTGYLLAAGVSLSGVLQLVLLWIAAQRAGYGIGLRWPRLTSGMRDLVTLAIPGFIAGGITQINLMIGGMIASFQVGAVSYLYYADRLYQLPLGVVGVAIGVVLLPDIAAKLRAGDHAAVADSQNRSFEFALLLTLPAAVALVVAAEPIVRVLFERGAFGALETRATAAALAVYALGLPAFVLQKVFQPAYFAREDTRTPMHFALVNLILNVALSLALFWLFGQMGLMPHIGLAIATTLSGWVNTMLLWATLRKRGDFALDAQALRRAPRIVVASLLMGGVLIGLRLWLDPYMTRQAASLVRVAALAGLVGCGLATFAAAGHLLGAANWRDYIGRRRRG